MPTDSIAMHPKPSRQFDGANATDVRSKKITKLLITEPSLPNTCLGWAVTTLLASLLLASSEHQELEEF